MSQSWKRAELHAARDVGCERIPATGAREGADFISGPFCYQLKVRRALPAWLFDWLGGICATAKVQGKAGILILNRPRQPRRSALVVLRWSDWCDLVGRPSEATDDRPDDPEGSD